MVATSRANAICNLAISQSQFIFIIRVNCKYQKLHVDVLIFLVYLRMWYIAKVLLN